MGALYGYSIGALGVFSVVEELAAVVVLFWGETGLHERLNSDSTEKVLPPVKNHLSPYDNGVNIGGRYHPD